MEIKIINPTSEGFVKAIDWNYEEIKEELENKVAVYGQMVYDENQIKEAKADRADLNKFKKALDDKRKEVKAQCLAPYEKFEKQMKEIIAIVDKPISLIDGQVKAFEEDQKRAKEEELKAYYQTIDFNGFSYESIANPKWLNATVSIKSAKEELDQIASDVAADLQILKDLQEYSFEAIQMYMKTRDVRASLNEAKALADMAKAKAEYERQQEEAKAEAERMAAEPKEEAKAEAERMAAEPKEEAEAVADELPTFDDDFLPEFEEAKRDYMALKVLVSDDERKALTTFLEMNGIEYTVL